MRHDHRDVRACPLCGAPSSVLELAEAAWMSKEVEARLVEEHPRWRRSDGACPACVQHALLEVLLARGDEALHTGIQRVWPLDAEAAFGALPTPLRLHADPRYTGRGVTMAVIDAAFYPHEDLTMPRNRIRTWVDASVDPVIVRRFGADELPRWPGWGERESSQWHGLMTAAAAAGNGWLSHGLYRGMAPEAELVLVQVRDGAGHIGNDAIARALRWLRSQHDAIAVRVANVSLGGDPVALLAGNPVDEAVRELVEAGVVVVVAAGNDGERRLVPPATAPSALTIGGVDDRNTFDHAERALWHSNYGGTVDGATKPELVAPSIWVVAPVLPGTSLAHEGASLFAARAKGVEGSEARIAELKLVTPHYQHVEGTSFASPLVAGVVACMLEANPALGPRHVRALLVEASRLVPGASAERQGAGAIDAGRAVTLALAEHHTAAELRDSPIIEPSGVRFLLHHHAASEVRLGGSWDGWRSWHTLREIDGGLWEVQIARPAPGTHAYKFLIDGSTWLEDPGNSARVHDGFGGWNSVIVVPVAHEPPMSSTTASGQWRAPLAGISR